MINKYIFQTQQNPGAEIKVGKLFCISARSIHNSTIMFDSRTLVSETISGIPLLHKLLA